MKRAFNFLISLALVLSFALVSDVSADTQAPTLDTFYPADGSVEVPVATSFTLNFSESMNTSSADSTVLRVTSSNGNTYQGTIASMQSNGWISYSWTNSNQTLSVSFSGSNSLANNRSYTIELVSTSATDVAGNALQVSQVKSTFYTATDANAPLINGIGVGSNSSTCTTNLSAANVNKNMDINGNATPTFCVEFSKLMNQSTIRSSSFKITNTTSSVSIEGQLSTLISQGYFNDVTFTDTTKTVAFLQAAKSLDTNDTYSVVLTNRVAQDTSGNLLKLEGFTGSTSTPVSVGGSLSSGASGSAAIYLKKLLPADNSANVGVRPMINFQFTRDVNVQTDFCASSMTLTEYTYSSGAWSQSNQLTGTISSLIGNFSIYDTTNEALTSINCSTTSSGIRSVTLVPNASVLNTDKKYTLAFSGAGSVSGSMSSTFYTVQSTISTLNAPTLVITPADGSEGVAVTENIVFTFSKAMDTASVSASTFELIKGSTTVLSAPLSSLSSHLTTSWSSSNDVLTINLTSDLSANSIYTVKFLAPGARSSDNNILATAVNESTFYTVFSGSSAPTMTSFGIASGASSVTSSLNGVAVTSSARAIFSKAMDTDSLNGATFTIKRISCAGSEGTNTISGTIANLEKLGYLSSVTWSSSNTILTIDPVDSYLDANCSYSVTLSKNTALSSDGFLLNPEGNSTVLFDTYSSSSSSSLTISSVSAAALGNYSAYVNWTTSEVATSQVKFCKTTDGSTCAASYKLSDLDSFKKVAHSLILSGLEKNTQYLVHPVSTTSTASVTYTTATAVTTKNTTSTISDLVVWPDNPTKSQSTTYAIEFFAPSPIPKDGKIKIDFPSGFTLTSASVTSNSSLTVSKTSLSSNSLILSLGGSADKPASLYHFIELSGITNHATAGSYTVSLSTQNNAGQTLDNSASRTVKIIDAAINSTTGTQNLTTAVSSGEAALQETFNAAGEGIAGAVLAVVPQSFSITDSSGAAVDLSSFDLVKSETLTETTFVESNANDLKLFGDVIEVGDADATQNFGSAVDITVPVNIPTKPANATDITNTFGADFTYSASDLTDDIYSRLYEVAALDTDTGLWEVKKNSVNDNSRVNVSLSKASKVGVRAIKDPLILELDTGTSVDTDKPTLLPKTGVLPKAVSIKNASDTSLKVDLAASTNITSGGAPYNGFLHPPTDISSTISSKSVATNLVSDSTLRSASKFVSVGAQGKTLSLSSNATLNITGLDASKTYSIRYYDGSSWQTQSGASCTAGQSSCSFTTDHFTIFAAVATGSVSSGGGGGGGSSVDTSTPFVLSTSETSSTAMLYRPLDLRNTFGEITRPVEMKNYGYGHEVSIEKGTEITRKDGSKYTGKLMVPTPVARTSRPDTPAGFQTVRVISVGSDDTTLMFSKPYTLKVKISLLKEVDPANLGLYYFNTDSDQYEFVQGMEVSSDQKIITATLDHMSMFAVLYADSQAAKNQLLQNAELSPSGVYSDLVGDSKVFRDVKNHWAASYVDALSARGVMKGRSTDQFAPNSFMNRAEFVTAIARAYELDVDTELSSTSFADVSLTDWFAPYVEAAVRAGLVKGYEIDGKNYFKPAANVNRAEALKIIVEAEGVSLPAYERKFLDVNEDQWYARYVNYAASRGIVKGKSDRLFAPGENATRAEIAKIIYLTQGK